MDQKNFFLSLKNQFLSTILVIFSLLIFSSACTEFESFSDPGTNQSTNSSQNTSNSPDLSPDQNNPVNSDDATVDKNQNAEELIENSAGGEVGLEDGIKDGLEGTIQDNQDHKPDIAISRKVVLRQFQSCQEMEQRFKDEMIRYYKRETLRTPMSWIADDMVMDVAFSATADMADGSSAEKSGSSESRDFSETNVQEQGVDEGDIIKTDGFFMYLIRNNHLIITDTKNPQNPKLIAQRSLNNFPRELYIYENTLIILSQTYVQDQIITADDSQDTISLRYIGGRSIVEVNIFNIADKSNPILQGSYQLPGYQSGSRRIGSRLFIVHNDSFRLPDASQAWDFLSDQSWYYSDEQQQEEFEQKFKEASQKALVENIKKINGLGLKNFWPQYTYTNHLDNSNVSGEAVSCEDFYFPESGNGNDLGMVSVIDLASQDFRRQSNGIMTSWGQIYMSLDNLYLTSTNHWLWVDPLEDGDDLENPEPQTGIHKFQILNQDDQWIQYQASGVVNGWVNDQFSMSDYQGYLRIGTTRGGWWGEQLSNQLTILGQRDNTLVEVGKIENLAQGERIYSMRFDRSRAYMVTFRQTDPLFSFDLSDPSDPKKMAELKVSGFSTYIHLIGQDNSVLLTIGRETDETGRLIGNKLQLFDVSDLSNPSVIDSFQLGEGWSQALYDHHAFLYYQAMNILAIPFADWTSYSYQSGLRVFSLSSQNIAQVGEILHAVGSDNYNYNMIVDRAVIIENSILSVSSGKILSNALPNLDQTMQVELPQYNQYDYPVVW